jgi:hypothetical protein
MHLCVASFSAQPRLAFAVDNRALLLLDQHHCGPGGAANDALLIELRGYF